MILGNSIRICSGSKQLLLMICIALSSCGNVEKRHTNIPHTQTKNKETQSDNDDVKKAQMWLIRSVEHYFNHENTEANKAKIFTGKYYAYKQDVINIDYDGMTLSEFEQKWGKQFNTKYAGIGTAFLLSGQDYGKIKVTSCELISTTPDSSYVFKTIITDTQFKIDYIRDIKTIHSGDTFLIADILEYN